MKLPKLPTPDPGKPQSKFDKIMSTTPIALTVIATVLAGLSSSSMNLGQYYRGLATQGQSKAGDQWNLFQAKKLRQSGIDNTIMILNATAHAGAFDPKAITTTMPAEMGDENVAAALRSAVVPQLPMEAIQSPSVLEALKAIEAHQPEEKIKSLAGAISEQEIDDALAVADRNYSVFDAAITSINSALDRIAAVVDKQHPEISSAFSIARLRFSSKRYAQDAKFNQTPGELYEIEVRRNSILADRYRVRSKQFFWAMLAAQAGVMAATFSITMKQKGLLWSAATALGLFALGFAAYIYVFV